MPKAAQEDGRMQERVKRAAEAAAASDAQHAADRVSSDLDARMHATHSRQRRAGGFFTLPRPASRRVWGVGQSPTVWPLKLDTRK